MEAKVVLDISSVVWDENNFNSNPSSYYILKSEIFLFIQAFKKCSNLKFVARKELLNNIMNLFPYKICNEHKMYDFQKLVLHFLSTKRNASYTNINNSSVYSIPNICYSYFSTDLQTEICYLITEIHSSADNYIFCTFRTCWQNNSDLQTNNGNPKTHQTVVHEDAKPTIQDYYLNNIRNVFEHSEKHDSNKGKRKENNEWIYPLSCYDERVKDTTIPQQLLDIAKQYEDEYYCYDTKNRTFVCFKRHKDNKYHGYDEDIKNVPRKIREEFHK